MLDIKNLLKLTGNEFASIAEDGVPTGDFTRFIDSGSYALNALLSADLFGGYPSNKIVMVGSPPSSGKCMRGSETIDLYFESDSDFLLFSNLSPTTSPTHNSKNSIIRYQITYKELIEKLAPKRVVGWEVKTDFPVYVRTPTGFTRIEAVIEKPAEEIQRTYFSDGSQIDSSEHHIYLTFGMQVFAKYASVVDTVNGQVEVLSKEIVSFEPTYDISIAPPHVYIPNQDNGILHHNTYLAIGSAKNFLDQNPNGIVFYFESESAITREMLKKRGVDLSRFAVIPVVTVQDFRNQAVKILDNYEAQGNKEDQPLFFILDSLGMLSTDKELAEASAGSDTRDMTRAQLLKGAFRILTLRLGRANIPLFVTNHVYDAIGSGPYAAAVPSGGCLEAGTKIITADGLKNIEDVRVGDLALTHEGVFEEVLATYVFEDKDIYEVDLEDGVTLRCSADHKFMVNGEWTEVRRLDAGVDVAVVQKSEGTQVTAIRKMPDPVPVYDISVNALNSYVLENGVVCHNSGGLYAASVIMSLSKAKDKDSNNQVTGVIVTVTATKSRLTREQIKVKCLIRFDGGLDRYYGLIELAEASGVFKKTSRKYELPDGTSEFQSKILGEPEKYFTKDVLNQINEWVKANFAYGVTRELPIFLSDES